MSARWVESKRAKIKKAYLKRPKYQGIDRERYGTYHDRIKSYAEAQPEPQTRGTENWNPDTIQKIQPKLVLNKQGKAEERDPVHPRQRVFARWCREMGFMAWQSDRHQGIDEFTSVVMLNTKIEEIKMFFSGNRFFFTKEYKFTGRQVRSTPYVGRDRAMRAYNLQRICWVFSSPSPAVEDSPDG